MPRLDVRAVDVALASILLGASISAYTKAAVVPSHFALALYSASAVAAILAAIIIWISLYTCLWISTYHLTHYDARKDTLVRPQRKAGHEIPCPYPDAWYAVAFAEELRPGQVKDIVVCNQNLIVFRPQLKPGDTRWPAPAVLDAYCTHLGAHLALGGGRVEGDCVRCPFHGWCFDSTGALTSTPSGDCPSGNDIRSWPSMERNGVISVWMSSSVHTHPSVCRQTVRPVKKEVGATACAVHKDKEEHKAGEVEALAASATAIPENKPWFEVPAGMVPHSLTYHGCTENIVQSVLWENPENGADVAHLNALHDEFVIPALYPFLSHRWDATWAVRDVQPVLADMSVKESIVLMKTVVLPGEVNVHITQCGPSQVFIDMTTPIGRVLVVETVTPISPRSQRVMHALYAAAGVPRIMAKAILYATMFQYERDVPVWCNKVYHPRPALAKHDPAIGAYRRWRKQFIQPGAITYVAAVKAHVADQLGLPAESGLEW